MENISYTEDEIEIYSFSMNFSGAEIRIEINKISITENRSEITYLSTVFSSTET